MSEEISIHQAPRPARVRRLQSRVWVGLGLGVILLLLGGGACSVVGSALFAAGPDTLQFVGVTPASKSGGRFSIQFRLRRADGGPMASSTSITADLVDVKTGKQLLGRQCGISVDQSAVPRALDVTLTDLLPAGLTQPRRVRARVEVRAIPPKEVFEYALWELSRRKTAPPPAARSGWRTFTHELVLPPARPISPTGRE